MSTSLAYSRVLPGNGRGFLVSSGLALMLAGLFALAAAHALSSSVLYYCLPPAVTHLMRVGPGYLQELRWH